MRNEEFDKVLISQEEFFQAMALFVVKIEMLSVAMELQTSVTGAKLTEEQGRDMLLKAACGVIDLLNRNGVELTQKGAAA